MLETWYQTQNWSRDHTYSQADTTETINENSDHWARFRSGTDVPYHRVSINTIFHMQSKTLVHSAELSSSLFSATVHQLTLIGKVQGNVVPFFQKATPTVPKNDPIRYNTQDITTSSNKILRSSKAAHSILIK